MGLRQCEKCEEMVDEAKAFCPSCGHAFVEEQKRPEPSVFDTMEGTMQLGNTMYNQLLSDMGLNISAAPDKPEEAVAKPAAQPAVHPVAQPAIQQVIQPAAQSVLQPVAETATPAKSGKTKWLIIAGIAVVLLLLAVIVVVVATAIIWSQYR